jgi:hypothetical protein
VLAVVSKFARPGNGVGKKVDSQESLALGGGAVCVDHFCGSVWVW